jgi:hypothetical protein
MKNAFNPGLVVEDLTMAPELRTITLQKQAQTGRTGIQAELNEINRMLEKSRHN